MSPVLDVTLVLFDIDGTLLDTHGAGKRAFIDALAAVFRWQDDISYIRFGGATDLDILARIATRRGHPLTTAETEAFFAHLPDELHRAAKGTTPTLYPGVRELLRAVSSDARAIVGLVTGNIESCAQVKLGWFGIHEHFVLGAFGHEHADRNDIAQLAVRRAEQALRPGQRLAARFLIGDTPSDVAAARAIGATSIAVATGTYTAEELRAAGANHVVDSLADTRALIDLLGLA